MLRADRSQPGRSDSATEPVAKNMSRTRSSLFHLNSRYRFGRSFGLAGLSAAARRFGSNGDRADGAGTDREDHTDRCGTNYFRSNSEGIGTTGRGSRPRQNCCRSAKLIRASVGHKVLSRATIAVVSAQLADESSCRLNEALYLYRHFCCSENEARGYSG